MTPKQLLQVLNAGFYASDKSSELSKVLMAMRNQVEIIIEEEGE